VNCGSATGTGILDSEHGLPRDTDPLQNPLRQQGAPVHRAAETDVDETGFRARAIEQFADSVVAEFIGRFAMVLAERMYRGTGYEHISRIGHSRPPAVVGTAE
jgi:hypothetical protein